MLSKALLVQFDELTRGKKASGARLVLLVGLPYAGKSTLGVMLAKHGYVHVWATVVRKRMGLEYDRTLDVVVPLVEQLLAAKYPVVVDYVNHREADRQTFIDLARKAGVPWQGVWLDPGWDEIMRRCEIVMAGESSEGRSLTSKEFVEMNASEFQEPTKGFVKFATVQAGEAYLLGREGSLR